MIALLNQKIIVDEKDTLYVFECPEIARKAKPGQFVEVQVSDGTEPFLRRPISIFDVRDTELKLLVRTVGKGTFLMQKWEPGKEVDIIGPLGRGFHLHRDDKNVILAGGGIGAAPLYYLTRELLKGGKNVTLLFSPKRDMTVLKSFEDLQDNIKVEFNENRHTLPGVLEELFRKNGADVIYTCGPTAMMRTVVEKAQAAGIPSQVSLEEKMGCGIGICMGCVVPIKTRGNDFEYKRVCHDGPVFDGEEVIFE